MAETLKIYSAISEVMSQVGCIEKEKTNASQGFKYRGVDDVMNALQPALVKAKIFVVPEVLEQTREERKSKSGGVLIYSILKMKYTFYAEDGSSVSAVVIGEGMDNGDKASNKAMSVAFKYACFQILCIPTEEIKDPDGESPEPVGETERKSSSSKSMKKSKANIKEQRLEELYALALKKGRYKDAVISWLEHGAHKSIQDMTIEDIEVGFNLVKNWPDVE